MSKGFHSATLNYALALWLATVLALFVSFVLQLEPAQWSAITVWIIFIQVPWMNYSKILWWAFGTIGGALMAVVLTVFFNQTTELFLLFLSLWLAGCAAVATLVSRYRAYGWVLAGYTCAIVGMSAVEHPNLIFQLAVTRVSCIFIGMTAAILMISILLPKRGHWRETVHHLGAHLKASLSQAAKALQADLAQPAQFAWRHMVDRLSTLEHTLDVTTAETAESRIHAAQASNLVGALFDLLAKAQAVEVHLTRAGALSPPEEIKYLLTETGALLSGCARTIFAGEGGGVEEAAVGKMERLRQKIDSMLQIVPAAATPEAVSNRFVCERLDEILEHFSYAIQDWRGLFGPWTARRASNLAVHRDYRSAAIYGLRMFLSMGMASALWFITQWPSGSMFILFNAVVCSLLSLMEQAPELGFELVKSASFCAIMAYIETFWWQQRSEGFAVLALMLGLFLLPAAYAYRHPRLIGGAVISMLVFYGLSMPSNQMNYDITIFLNNGMALLCAVVCGFFAFHAVPSLNSPARRFWLLREVRRDLADGGLVDSFSEQRWISRTFDRLRLLHRTSDPAAQAAEGPDAENEMLIDLQLGLRQRRLHAYHQDKTMTPPAARLVDDALGQFRNITRHPNVAALFLRSACARFQETLGQEERLSNEAIGALAEMWEITLLLETSTRLYFC